MVDIASLGIAINSKDARKAAQELDGFKKSAGEADKATDKLNAAAERQVRAMLASAQSAARAAAADLKIATSARTAQVAIDREALATEKLGAARAGLGAIGGLGKGLLGGAAGALSLGVLANAAQDTVKSIADIGDEATKLGLTTGYYQELAFAAKLAGIETGSLAGFTKILARNSSDAARGQGEFAQLLKDNGISLRDNNGQMKSQADVLKIVADLVKNAANEQDALKIATIAGGRQGAEAMGLLQGGAEGVERAFKDAGDEGLKFTEEQIKAANEFDDALDKTIKKISVGLKSAFLTAAQTAKSAFEDAAVSIAGAVAQARGFQNIDEMAKYDFPDQFSGKVDLNGITTSGFRANKDDVGSLLNSVDGQAQKTKIRSDADEEAAKEAKRRADEAKRQAEQRAKAIQDVIKSLQFEGQQLNRNERDQAIYNEVNRAGVSITSEHGRLIAAQAAANFDLAKSLEDEKKRRADATEELKKYNKEQAEARDKTRVGEFDRQAEIQARTFSRGLSDGFNNYMQEASDYATYAKDLVTNFSTGLENAFVQFAQTGKLSFREMTSSILSDMGRMSLKMATSGLFGALLGGGRQSLYGDAGGGFLSGLLSFLPGFATGADRVPNDMVAKIHKDEMIIPKQGADAIRSGAVSRNSSAPQINYSPTMNFSGGMNEREQRLFAEQIRKQTERDIPMLMQKHSANGKI